MQTFESPARGEPLVFSPNSQGAERYNDPPRTPVPSTPLGDAITAAVATAAAEQGVAAPQADPRLFAAARELAEVAPANEPLAYPLIEFAMQRHGIVEPSPHLVLIWGQLDDPAAILQQLAPRLPQILAAGSFSRVGVGSSMRGPRGEGLAILALQSSNLATAPIPRALPEGGAFRIEGKLLGRYREPEVFVTHENGVVTRPELRRRGTHGFAAEVSCRGRRGKQQIEVTAIDASGSTVLANFPVWCNAEAPSSLTVPVSEDALRPMITAAAAEERMLELLNRDRQRHGLPPLSLSAPVAGVARAHSEDMHATGVVAHVLPSTGSAADRIKAADIRTGVVLENVARAYGVAEAQEGLMNSPGHRANVLSDRATHVGIGIVLGDEVAGRREMFVTQVFTRVPPKITASRVRQRVQAKMQAARPNLVHDEALAALAALYARDVARGLGTEDAAQRARAQLGKLAERFSRVTTVVTAVADVDAFEASSVLTEPRTTHYGLGIAQGDHDVLGEGAVYIVVLAAESRAR